MGINQRVSLRKFIDDIHRWVEEGRSDEWIASALGTSPSSVQSFRSRNAIYRRTDSPLVLRSGTEIAEFFTGLDVVPPGVVPLAEWRPDSDDAYISAYAGVGRKP